MKRFLKVLLKVWIWIWLFFAFMTLMFFLNQMREDNNFIREEMEPSVEYIESFKNEKGRLPTEKEYYFWEGNYYNILDDKENESNANYNHKLWYHKSSSAGLSKFDDLKINWDKHYTLSVWRGEWSMYYYSWSKEYDTNNFTLLSVLKYFFLRLLPALIPLIGWRIYKNKKKTSSKK